MQFASPIAPPPAGSIQNNSNNNNNNAAIDSLLSAPSIPSKYSTVLLTGANHHQPEAFNSRVARFSSSTIGSNHSFYSDISIPAVGLYYNPQYNSLGSNSNTQISHSKKGYGSGFVSKSARFKHYRSSCTNTPAPGTYNIDSNYSIPGPVLKPPVNNPNSNKSTVEIKEPGPGQYNPYQSKSIGYISNTIYTNLDQQFLSTTDRFNNPANRANNSTAIHSYQGQHRSNKNNNLTGATDTPTPAAAVFKSNTNRDPLNLQRTAAHSTALSAPSIPNITTGLSDLAQAHNQFTTLTTAETINANNNTNSINNRVSVSVSSNPMVNAHREELLNAHLLRKQQLTNNSVLQSQTGSGTVIQPNQRIIGRSTSADLSPKKSTNSNSNSNNSNSKNKKSPNKNNTSIFKLPTTVPLTSTSASVRAPGPQYYNPTGPKWIKTNFSVRNHLQQQHRIIAQQKLTKPNIKLIKKSN